MPKLYHHARSWQVPGRQDRKAARVDVPSSPAELAAWLNSRRVPLEGDAFDGITPLNAAADELLGEVRDMQLSGAPAETGVTITEAEVDRVNDDRPAFLPRLSAEEIEARRMAERKCPKCGRGLDLYGNDPVEAISTWIGTAELDELKTVAERIKSHVAKLNSEIDGRSVQ